MVKLTKNCVRSNLRAGYSLTVLNMFIYFIFLKFNKTTFRFNDDYDDDKKRKKKK